jgi:hypothetical protein
VLNEHGWHWAFYAYGGDGDWTGLGYEIGFDPVDPRILGRREARKRKKPGVSRPRAFDVAVCGV